MSERVLIAPRAVLIASVLLMAALVHGCGWRDLNPERRRETLLKMYPPGETARADVHTRWGNWGWNISETPPGGWMNASNADVRQRVLKSEQRTGRPVHRVESRLTPDGWSGGLCVCWFYYDQNDRVADVEWQWHTD